MQIEARIDQHPDIAQLLTLWAQRGSSVIRGNMLVLPIERSLLYLKPIYLQAETGDLPELVRVIAAFGDEIAMHPTLDEALRAVIRGDAAAVDTAPPPSLTDVVLNGDGEPPLAGLPAPGLPGVSEVGEDPAVGPGMPGTEADGPSAGGEDVRGLAEEALSLYERAQERLQAGD